MGNWRKRQPVQTGSIYTDGMEDGVESFVVTDGADIPVIALYWVTPEGIASGIIQVPFVNAIDGRKCIKPGDLIIDMPEGYKCPFNPTEYEEIT